jgi:hypothetical protein
MEAKEVALECLPSGCEGAGEETPSEPKSLGDGDEGEDVDEEQGEITPSPNSLPPDDLPRFVTSSASKWRSPLACAR